MDDLLRIGELGARLGLSTATLRYYESLGLLGEPERSPSGYRLYDSDAEDRLRFILRAKALDLSLDEIRSLLGLWREGSCVEHALDAPARGGPQDPGGARRAREAEAFADQLTHVYTRLGEEAAAGSDGCACIPDLPAPVVGGLEAELALIEQSVCGCGAKLDEAGVAAVEGCACGCCTPGAEITPANVRLTTKDREEVRTP